MLKLALDFDNVLADTMSTWIKYYNEIHTKSLTKQDIKKWEFWKDLRMPEDKVFEIYRKVWSDLQNLPLIEKDASLIVKELKKMTQLDIVTAVRSDVKSWLDGKAIPYNEIVYSQKKTELDYDVFIDDSPLVAEALSEQKICLVYDQPWNQNIEKSKSVIKRINSLEGAVQYLKTIP
jgi:uncharacterized protein